MYPFDNLFQEFLHPNVDLDMESDSLTIFEAPIFGYFNNIFQEILIPKPGTILTSFEDQISAQTWT